MRLHPDQQAKAARPPAQRAGERDFRRPAPIQRLVQEQLYLSATLKNTYYKAAAQLYMRKHGYPFEPCVASAAHPFGDGPGCKKVGINNNNK